MRSWLLFYLLLIPYTVSGQVISGVIRGEDKEPLPAVTVVADDSIGVVTDINGRYSLKVSPGKHVVQFRLISFKTEQRTVTVGIALPATLDIILIRDVTQLNMVVISAGKFEQKLEEVTVSMEVLKPSMIVKRNSVAMDEAIDYVPGVSIVDGQANIRGGSGWSYGAGSRVQVLVDDLPQLTADASDVKWNFLPVENLEQVEVVKGASSVLFGSSALNGVINVRTAYPRDTPQTKVNLFYGVYDKAYITTDRRYSLSYGEDFSKYFGASAFHSRKFKRLDFVMGLNALKDNGYRQGENENRIRLNANTRYNFKTPGLSAGLNINTMVNDATIFFLWKNDTSGAYMPAENTLSDIRTLRLNVDPYVTYVGRKGTSHKLRTRWFRTTNENNTNQDSNSDLFYTEYQFQKRISDLTVTAGLVNIYSLVESELYGDHDGNQQAGYLQTDYTYKKLTLSAGARAEKNRTDDISDDWTPVFRGGVNVHALKLTYIRASFGQGYRFPSIAERYVSTSIGNAKIFPNPDLIAEEGISAEIGLRQGFTIDKWRGYLDVAFFRNDYENMMEFVFAQWGQTGSFFNDFGFRSMNIGDTRIRGFEITLQTEGRIANSVDVNLQGGYVYIDPRQITFDSVYVAKVGEQNAMGSDSSDFLKYRWTHTVKADLDLKRRKFGLGWSARYSSRVQNIDMIFVNGLLDLSFPPGLGIADYRKYHMTGDLIVDMRLSYDIKKCLVVALIVKNMFNHIYMQRPADMQPPRTWVLQVNARL